MKKLEALQVVNEPVFITGDKVIMDRDYYEFWRAQSEPHPADKYIPQAIKEIEERRASGKTKYCDGKEALKQLRQKYEF